MALADSPSARWRSRGCTRLFRAGRRRHHGRLPPGRRRRRSPGCRPAGQGLPPLWCSGARRSPSTAPRAGTGLGRDRAGAAGDIGHVHLTGTSEPLCRCGNLRCLEAIAGGWALARDPRGQGIPAKTARDVVDLAQQGRPEAIQLLRQAGRTVGEAVAAAINLLDPDVLVLGGVLSQASDHLAAGVRELVYRRCLPLTTTNLRIESSRVSAEHAGVLGAAQLVIDRLLRLTPPSG
jgi:hypothetical protein